jgi:hypothetical protein
VAATAAEERRERVRKAAARLQKVEDQLLTAQALVPSMVREVQAIREEIDAALAPAKPAADAKD